MSSSTSIIAYLQAIPDKRRSEGTRHDQTFIILLVIMSAMSGYVGYRGAGDFIKRNKADLQKYFEPKKGRLPSFDTVRRVIQSLDFTLLSKQFHQWTMQYIALPQAEWVSIDGKAIRGIAKDYDDGKQRFLNLISLYCSKQKLVIGNAAVDNSKENEIPIVQQLIAALDIKGVTFTLDALHCQKKRQQLSSTAATIM